MVLTPLLALIPLAAIAAPDTGDILHAGLATYYHATGAGACMFDAAPDNLMVCAMNAVEYDTASVCGAWVRITGPRGEVTVRIVDLCPGCKVGDIDLSVQAFAHIADTLLGRVAITWRYVPGDVTGPIAYRIKTGSNQWWTAVQVLNHRTAVASVELKSGASWVTVTRTSYNYFLKSDGMGAGPYTFRVTDIYGRQLTDAGVPLAPGAITQGRDNFPPPGAGVGERRRAAPAALRVTANRQDLVIADRRAIRGVAVTAAGRLTDVRGRAVVR